MLATSTGLVLQYLRCRRNLSRPQFTALFGWADPTLIGRYEQGEEELSEERLRQIASVLGYLPEEVDLLLFTDALIAPPPRPEPPSPLALGEEEHRQLARTSIAAAWTLTDGFWGGLAQVSREERRAQAFEKADELLERLLPLTPAEQRAMVTLFPEFRLWSLAVRLCEASVEAASDRAEKALELAELACWVAARVNEPPGFRLRLLGYCLHYLGNARRVADDFDGAA